MTAKEYLKQYRVLDADIRECTKRLDELQSRREYSSPQPSGGIAYSQAVDKVANLAEAIVDTQAMLDKLIMLKAEIVSRVESVPNLELRTVLRLRYIDGLSVENVSERMYYSLKTINTRILVALAYFEGRFGDIL